MPTLFLCGDVMTGRGIDQILARPADHRLHEQYVKDARDYVRLARWRHGQIPSPADDAYVWGFALDRLRRFDPAARVINLETAVTSSGCYWEGKGIHYRMSPENAGCLAAAKIDCCALANNHVLDWGFPGLAETLQTLRRRGLKTAGAGSNAAEAWTPAVLPTADGARILVFAAATPSSGAPPDWAAEENRPGVALLPDLSDETIEKIADSIAPLRRDSDLVVVSMHWGNNWGYKIPVEHRYFAHRLIERADAHVVHGHSSHHVKGVEVHRRRLILYGCGDLIADYEGISGRETFRGDLGLMYFPQIEAGSGNLISLVMQPTRIQRMQLRRPNHEELAWLTNVLNREGRSLGTGVTTTEEETFQLQWED